MKFELKSLNKYAVDFVINKQLKGETLWDKCINVFVVHPDSEDHWWKCEFFGKMLRGAALIYQVSHDEELYEVLTRAVKKFLTTQDELGRFSSYTVKEEFNGWDMWGRKYVISSLLHYREICKDESLKEQIVNALIKHTDYIVEHVGPNEGQKDITETSIFYGGLNSCSILETIVAMYNVTKKQSYLDFANYIASTGGTARGNVIDDALTEGLMPCDFSETKIYELTSFFEGLFELYKVTGEERLYKAFVTFLNKVRESDLTITGCSGTYDEFFNHSSVTQSEPFIRIGQETCVAVTWNRVIAKYYEYSHESWVLDELEKTWLNVILGSFNTRDSLSYDHFITKDYFKGLPFDSYSPLANGHRGKATAGLQYFPDGGAYGCCACIAAAGIALYPLHAVEFSKESIKVNFFTESTYTEGNESVSIKGDFIKEDKVSITVSSDSSKSIIIRQPYYADNMQVSINKQEIKAIKGEFKGEISKGDNNITITFNLSLKAHKLNARYAFTYGPLVLAQDSEKSEYVPVSDQDVKYLVREEPKNEEIVRFSYDKYKVLLTDYQSCGKAWNDKSIINVWNIKRIYD